MAGSFEVTPSQLGTAATGIGQAVDTLQSQTAALQDTIDGSGNPWGGDEQGSLFGTLYQAALGHVMQVMSTHQDELRYAAGSLTQSARVYTDTDTGVADRFTSLGEGL